MPINTNPPPLTGKQIATDMRDLINDTFRSAMKAAANSSAGSFANRFAQDFGLKDRGASPSGKSYTVAENVEARLVQAKPAIDATSNAIGKWISSMKKAAEGTETLTKWTLRLGRLATIVKPGMAILEATIAQPAMAARAERRGELSKAFEHRFNASNLGWDLLGLVPGLGSVASRMKEYKAVGTGLRNDQVLADAVLQGRNLLRDGTHNSAIQVAQGSLQASYAYQPEALAYQQRMLDIKVKYDSLIEGKNRAEILQSNRVQGIQDSIIAEEQKMVRDRGTSLDMVGKTASSRGPNGEFIAGNISSRHESLKRQEAIHRQLMVDTSKMEGNRDKLITQAGQEYERSFYHGMGTATAASYVNVATATADGGGSPPPVDPVVQGLDITNGYLEAILDAIRGPAPTHGFGA